MQWNKWEDYTAGLYSPDTDPAREYEAAQMLADPDQFMEAALEMLREWPNAAVQNLEHMWSGRNAWLGQATACYSFGATAQDTKNAWGTLTNQQQKTANEVAAIVRESWEKGRHDEQTLFTV